MMRLTDYQLKSIKEAFIVHFFEKDKIWLFGSRTDISKRGGDIDLYIETNYIDFAIIAQKKIAFLTDLKRRIGEQKIDIVINSIPKNLNLPIHNEAKNTGIQLI